MRTLRLFTWRLVLVSCGIALGDLAWCALCHTVPTLKGSDTILQQVFGPVIARGLWCGAGAVVGLLIVYALCEWAFHQDPDGQQGLPYVNEDGME